MPPQRFSSHSTVEILDMMSKGRGMCRDTSTGGTSVEAPASGSWSSALQVPQEATEAAESAPYLGADLGWGFTSGSVGLANLPLYRAGRAPG